MLAYAAMMTDQSELAIKHIRAMVAGLPQDFLKEYAAAGRGICRHAPRGTCASRSVGRDPRGTRQLFRLRAVHARISLRSARR